jgi:hypothetical protein
VRQVTTVSDCNSARRTLRFVLMSDPDNGTDIVRSTADIAIRGYESLDLQSEHGVSLGKFYTDEQVQEAIAALESNSPGIWEIMKRLASNKAPPDEEHEIAVTAVTRITGITYPKLSFIAQASDKNKAIHELNIDMGNAVRAAVASAKGGSASTSPTSKND